MTTSAKGAPVAVIETCVAALAAWMREQGFVGASAEDPMEVMFALDERVNESRVARAVFGIYFWLWVDVLPAIDGRRAAEQKRAAKRKRRRGQPNSEAFADLYFGDAERKAAAKVRAINASIEHLANQIENVAQRQTARARVFVRASEDGERLRRVFIAWAYIGGYLRSLIEPSIPARPQPIPHTTKEWQETRVALEAELRASGMSASAVARVLPGGGGATEVYRRGRRAK